MAVTIRIIRRVVCFSALSSAYFAQLPPLSSTWQSVQFKPSDAEKNPIVPMN
jgi:predicted HD phosphohydrolase